MIDFELENNNFWKQWEGEIQSDKRNERMLWVIDKMEERDIKTVIDVGCAYGWHAKLLQEKGYDVAGCDFSEHAIIKAKEIYPSIPFFKESAEKVKGNYDAVICLAVLNMVEDDIIAYNNIAKLAKWGYYSFQTYSDHILHTRHYNEDSVKKLIGDSGEITNMEEIRDFIMVEVKYDKTK